MEEINQNPAQSFCSLFEAHCHIKPLMKTKTTSSTTTTKTLFVVQAIGLQPFYLELAYKSDHFQAYWLIPGMEQTKLYKINGHSGYPNYMHLTTFYHIFWNLPKKKGKRLWQRRMAKKLSRIYLSTSLCSTSFSWKQKQ